MLVRRRRAGWRECVGVKSQFRNHEALVRKLLEDAREPQYGGFCMGEGDDIALPFPPGFIQVKRSKNSLQILHLFTLLF